MTINIVKMKSGQIYKDESGKVWKFLLINRVSNQKADGPRMIKDESSGRFEPVDDVKAERVPHHPHRCLVTIKYDGLTFVANNETEYKMMLSGIDLRPVNAIKAITKTLNNLRTDPDDWTYSSIISKARGLKLFCDEVLSDKINDMTCPLRRLKSLMPAGTTDEDVRNLIIQPMATASERTMKEVKKAVNNMNKARKELLHDHDIVRGYVNEYVNDRFHGDEAEFLQSLVSYQDIIYKIDIEADDLWISDVNVKHDVERTFDRGISYDHHYNEGSCCINCVTYSGRYYSSKSNGWDCDS